MYCKKCGKLIADDSVYCKYCGTNQNEVTTSEAKPKPIKVDVNAKVDAKLVPSINTSWYKKFTDLQKKLLWGYGAWFLLHLILLVSGRGRNGFFLESIKTMTGGIYILCLQIVVPMKNGL